MLKNLYLRKNGNVALRDDEKPRLVADLAMNNFMILRSHGLLTCAPTIPDAFLAMYILETACQIQLKAQVAQKLTSIHVDILSTIQQQAQQVTKNMGGALAWPALLRKLDRMDPSFRD